jgi:hypothetical protein
MMSRLIEWFADQPHDIQVATLPKEHADEAAKLALRRIAGGKRRA